MKCAVCGGFVKTHRTFPIDALAFCSKTCLLQHIEGQKSLSTLQLQGMGLQPSTADNWGFRSHYSVRLGVHFRSWFECDVAETLVFDHDYTDLQYEPHQLFIDEKHRYVPDFFFKNHGVWLEVKGEWRGGGKHKFCQALHLLGRNRLVIIPDSYKSWFKIKR